MQAGQEHNPYTLWSGIDRISASISIGVTGLKTKEPASFCIGKKLEKLFCAWGILAAKLGPMEENHEFMILGT